jgi:hypothetical protein
MTARKQTGSHIDIYDNIPFQYLNQPDEFTTSRRYILGEIGARVSVRASVTRTIPVCERISVWNTAVSGS